MNPVFRNIFAFVAGVMTGGIVNSGIIFISSYIIAPPPGANLSTQEGLIAAMELMEPKHFLMPFLAHALGTLVGAFIAAKIAVSHQFKFATGVGIFFLIGGMLMILSVPSPLWFTIVDVLFAYIPMAYLGAKMAAKRPTV